MLSLQHLMASLWYCVWFPTLEDQERKKTVASPPLLPAGCSMWPRGGKSSKALVKTFRA